MTADFSRFGFNAPSLSITPSAEKEWAYALPFKEVADIVAAADRLGYDHVSCAEHIGVPSTEAQRRGVRYYDPLATFGYFAAITTNIRFTTAVLVLGYHHPLEIAKRYGTLDTVSGGRLVLGLGVGTLKEEFDLLGIGGAEFTERGARGDDALRALRASLGQPEPEYHGPYYDFAGLTIDPCAVQSHVPLWIGGRTKLSIQRAVELGDGWMPFGLSTEEMKVMIATAKASPAYEARERPLDFVLPPQVRVDPVGAPEKAAEIIRGLFDAGATKLTLSFTADSTSHYLEQLEGVGSLDV
ncbi:LLM class F420-dependent oxidoreductase [Sphingomonas sp. BIUV-7]|uniref:LLM class F420-dependent oxidoreductase n=1 Tax=Sphingomonas natans TaxID=3063330 RepID=A0ABT8Y8B9_9SPHN|nr:LLM class F420-dependent oxidoreductase [Sphingomonas sp. BIUV-7]MDO6414558.1 LLM class F420-dependent oxidoreductase [Sphingomonas sp. BIUV-7]